MPAAIAARLAIFNAVRFSVLVVVSLIVSPRDSTKWVLTHPYYPAWICPGTRRTAYRDLQAFAHRGGHFQDIYMVMQT